MLISCFMLHRGAVMLCMVWGQSVGCTLKQFELQHTQHLGLACGLAWRSFIELEPCSTAVTLSHRTLLESCGYDAECGSCSGVRHGLRCGGWSQPSVWVNGSRFGGAPTRGAVFCQPQAVVPAWGQSWPQGEHSTCIMHTSSCIIHMSVHLQVQAYWLIYILGTSWKCCDSATSSGRANCTHSAVCGANGPDFCVQGRHVLSVATACLHAIDKASHDCRIIQKWRLRRNQRQHHMPRLWLWTVHGDACVCRQLQQCRKCIWNAVGSVASVLCTIYGKILSVVEMACTCRTYSLQSRFAVYLHFDADWCTLSVTCWQFHFSRWQIE